MIVERLAEIKFSVLTIVYGEILEYMILAKLVLLDVWYPKAIISPDATLELLAKIC